MKIRLFLFFLIFNHFCFSQNLSSQFAGYSFDNQSLDNTFDAGNGTLTKTGTNAVFISGINNVVNNAISLNGDMLTGAPNNNETSVIDFSWSFWFKTGVTNQSRQVWRNYDNFQNEVNVNLLSDGRFQTEVRIGGFNGSVNTAEIDTPNYLFDNEWHHVVIVLQKYLVSGSGRLRIRTYIDGAEESDLYMDGINYGSIWQAGHLVEVNNYSDGLDEVNFYKNDLTTDDVDTLYSDNICTPNSLTTLNVTPTSFNLEWNADQSVTTWDVAISNYGANFNGNPTVSGLTATNYFVNGLQPGAKLNVFVRGVCNGIASKWKRLIVEIPVPIYVDLNANGNNDGSTWADAYNDLRIALANNPNAEFWITQGTYKASTGDRTLSFNITANQKLFGGFDGTETVRDERNPDANETILSGDINNNDSGVLNFNLGPYGDNTYHIIRVVGTNTVVDGLIIKGGNAVSGAGGEVRSGSAMIISQNVKNLKVNNVLFEDNRVNDAGTVFFNQTSPQSGDYNYDFTNCIFRNNLGRFASIYYASNPRTSGTMKSTFVNCLFYDNVVADVPAYNQGTNALFWFRTDVSTTHIGEFINCTIASNDFNATNNNASIIAGSRIGGSCTVNLYNSIIWDNKITSTGNEQTTIGSFGTQGVGTRVVRNSIAPSFSSGIAQNSSTADPLLGTFPGKYNFQIGNASSPAIDFGDNSFLPTSVLGDLLNNNRIENAAVDAGAYEFGAMALGVDDFEEVQNQLKIYPNPTTSILYIDSKQNIQSIYVFDMSGKQILKTTETTIDVSQLKQGIYILKAKSTLGEVVKRFVKQ